MALYDGVCHKHPADGRNSTGAACGFLPPSTNRQADGKEHICTLGLHMPNTAGGSVEGCDV